MLIPVILSGGAGTRLWPVSRAGHPKPFMQLADGESLLQKTLLRAAHLPGIERMLVITNRDYLFPTLDETNPLIATGALPAMQYLLEPCGRNTLPAIALGALALAEACGTQARLLVLPADHMIDDPATFAADVAVAAQAAAAGYLATFGIAPTHAETGFGYIERGETLMPGVCRINRFTEKPSLEVAQAYVAGGGHDWNAGMFCFAIEDFLAELALHQPDFLAAAQACWRASKGQNGIWNLDAAGFAALPNISIDYGVMEKTARAAVVSTHFAWSDIGSWDAVARLNPPDTAGNRHEGDALFIDSRDCYVRAEGRLVAALGVRNLFIVETADAVLVADREHAQKVKDVVGELRSRAHATALLHRTALRPWGAYTVLEEGPGFKIKRIEVKPAGCLSLQLHHQRSEHWVIVSGRARITNDDQTFEIGANESTYISPGHRHRLENIGTEPLVVIEVQCGAYLGEDDIVRLEDVYGR